MKNLLCLICLCIFAIGPIYAQENRENNSTETKKIIIKKKDGENKTIIIKKEKSNGDEDIQIEVDGEEVFEWDDAEFKNEFGFKEEDSRSAFNNKAVLGVLIENAGGKNGVSITRVFENSAAALAGLQAGDIIQKINGDKVLDIESLLDVLSKFQPGNTIKVGYLRNAELNVAETSLKERQEISYPEFDHQKVYNYSYCKPKCKEEIKHKSKHKNKSVGGENRIEKSLKNKNQSLSLSYLQSYPNPSTGQLTVKYRGDNSPVSIQIVDLNGKEVFSDRIENFTGEYSRDIQLDNTKGTVIINVRQGDNLISEKIVLE